jgi:hypothetical protein
LISYIFEIGIVFITFHLLWWLFLFFIKQLMGVDKQAQLAKAEAILKPVGLVILTALAGIKTLEFIAKSDLSFAMGLYLGLGAFLLYTYLLEKMRKGKAKMAFVQGRIQVDQVKQSKSDKIIVYGLIALFFLFVLLPQTVVNPFTTGLSKIINDVYETPIIGWIIGFGGVFFLARMVIMGIATIGQLFRKISNQQPPNQQKTDDGGFVDYEIVEDDEPEPDDRGNRLN